MARPPAPFALPQPRRDATDDHAADDQDQGEQRQRYRQRRVYLIEGVERNDDGLTVRNGENDKEERERNEDQRRDDLAEHDRASSFLVMPENRGHVRLALWPCKKSLLA